MTQTASTPTADDAVQQVRDINERVIGFSRKAGTSFLDAYETTGKTLADYQDKVADATQVGWATSIVHAQANVTREVPPVATRRPPASS